jgi:hypothetical protein
MAWWLELFPGKRWMISSDLYKGSKSRWRGKDMAQRFSSNLDDCLLPKVIASNTHAAKLA